MAAKRYFFFAAFFFAPVFFRGRRFGAALVLVFFLARIPIFTSTSCTLYEPIRDCDSWSMANPTRSA
jgi:hypothetical protein